MRPFAFARPRPALLALLLALAGHAGAQTTAAAKVEAVGDTVLFEGQINPPSAAAFLHLLQDPAIRRLVITSRGGMVTAALDMASAILARGLDVDVPTECRSSCANYIFPAGRRKSMGHPLAVAWHGNMTHVLYLQQTGQASWSPEMLEGARQLAVREQQFYRQAGVDGFVCWFGKIAPYDVDEFYALSADDMRRFGLGEVGIRDGPPPEAGGRDVRLLEVDWAQLDAIRPTVRLEP
ncbi:hypothetical protein ACFPOE_22415 [Caenimonas terrae]|uniref:Uncharacterized protein n=1 Tax=Caenimonas terrae TaxID=696074 RepID=A0ABW0NKQ8_9BURK